MGESFVDIIYGTTLSATQLNATADVAGTFAYTLAAGAKLNAGNNQLLLVSFVPTDVTNYNSPVTKSITKAELTVTADAKTVGTSDPTLTYRA